MPDIDDAEPSRPRAARRREPWTAVVSALTAVVATIIGVIAYVYPRDAGGRAGETGVEVVSPVATGQPGSTSRPNEPTAAAAGVFLDTLQPVQGGSWLRQLPRELSADPSYQHAVVISCPSNQTGDTASEVVYETLQRYQTLTGTLRLHGLSDGVPADLFVYQDAAERRPGGPTGSPPTQVRVTMGETAEVSAPASAAVYLRLRLVCEKPDGLMILTDARLIR